VFFQYESVTSIGNISNPLYGILKAIRLGREHRRCVTEQVAAGSFAEIRRLKILFKLISASRRRRRRRHRATPACLLSPLAVDSTPREMIYPRRGPPSRTVLSFLT